MPKVAEPIAASGEAHPVATVEKGAAGPAAAPVATPLQAAAPAAEPVAAEPVAGAPALVVAAAPPPPTYKDGTFTGWGTSRHGDIEATVTIVGGRIVSAVISQCWTRWSCSWIAALPPQVPARQSAEVDYVSGATQSTNAFYWAVVQALSKAR